MNEWSGTVVLGRAEDVQAIAQYGGNSGYRLMNRKSKRMGSVSYSIYGVRDSLSSQRHLDLSSSTTWRCSKISKRIPQGYANISYPAPAYALSRYFHHFYPQR
jgi:hypothetical protein